MEESNLLVKPVRGGARTGAGRPPAPKSDAVKRTRLSLDLTQEQFAHEMGCTTSALRLMEAENRLPAKSEVLRKFTRLAKRAGVSLEESESGVSSNH